MRVQTDVAANELSDAKQRELELVFERSVQRLFAELSRSLLARALIDSHKEGRARGSLRMRADDQACLVFVRRASRTPLASGDSLTKRDRHYRSPKLISPPRVGCYGDGSPRFRLLCHDERVPKVRAVRRRRAYYNFHAQGVGADNRLCVAWWKRRCPRWFAAEIRLQKHRQTVAWLANCLAHFTDGVECLCHDGKVDRGRRRQRLDVGPRNLLHSHRSAVGRQNMHAWVERTAGVSGHMHATITQMPVDSQSMYGLSDTKRTARELSR